MSDNVLRIFSYLPNPRVWKALIAARYLGLSVEVVGDKPKELGNWLWDFAARPLRDEEKVPENPNARQSRRGFSGTLYKRHCLYLLAWSFHRSSIASLLSSF